MYVQHVTSLETFRGTCPKHTCTGLATVGTPLPVQTRRRQPSLHSSMRTSSSSGAGTTSTSAPVLAPAAGTSSVSGTPAQTSTSGANSAVPIARPQLLLHPSLLQPAPAPAPQQHRQPAPRRTFRENLALYEQIPARLRQLRPEFAQAARHRPLTSEEKAQVSRDARVMLRDLWPDGAPSDLRRHWRPSVSLDDSGRGMRRRATLPQALQQRQRQLVWHHRRRIQLPAYQATQQQQQR